MAIRPSDLGPIEIALLGVLSIGLPPSRAAGSDTFRVDYVTAIVMGLRDGGVQDAHLQPGAMAITPEFRLQLRTAIEELTEKGLVTQQEAGMPAAPGGFEAGLEIDMVNPDEHPILLDRYLGQECMEVLFRDKAVYPYLMERYSASGEVWRKLRAGGYAS